jgi:hypothetical protein
MMCESLGMQWMRMPAEWLSLGQPPADVVAVQSSAGWLVLVELLRGTETYQRCDSLVRPEELQLYREKA